MMAYFRYTNHYDWPIRGLLDNAEEYIAQNYDQALDEFKKLLKIYPDSPRARYFLLRVEEMRLINNTKDFTSEDFNDKLNKILDNVQIMMKKYVDPEADTPHDQYEIMPIMFQSMFQHSVLICDTYNLIKKAVEFNEIAMNLNADIMGTIRYHMVNIQNNFGLHDFDGAKKTIDRAVEQFPESLIFQVRNRDGSSPNKSSRARA